MVSRTLRVAGYVEFIRHLGFIGFWLESGASPLSR